MCQDSLEVDLIVATRDSSRAIAVQFNVLVEAIID
jgi:hypothetical protein